MTDVEREILKQVMKPELLDFWKAMQDHLGCVWCVTTDTRSFGTGEATLRQGDTVMLTDIKIVAPGDIILTWLHNEELVEYKIFMEAQISTMFSGMTLLPKQ